MVYPRRLSPDLGLLLNPNCNDRHALYQSRGFKRQRPCYVYKFDHVQPPLACLIAANKLLMPVQTQGQRPLAKTSDLTPVYKKPDKHAVPLVLEALVSSGSPGSHLTTNDERFAIHRKRVAMRPPCVIEAL